MKVSKSNVTIGNLTSIWNCKWQYNFLWKWKQMHLFCLYRVGIIHIWIWLYYAYKVVVSIQSVLGQRCTACRNKVGSGSPTEAPPSTAGKQAACIRARAEIWKGSLWMHLSHLRGLPKMTGEHFDCSGLCIHDLICNPQDFQMTG